MDDSKIIELYFARNEEAITVSQKKYGGYCLAIARNILSDQADAEECVNDTWMRAWGAMPPQRPNCLSAFFGTITRNLSLNRWRQYKAAKRGAGEMPLALVELEECLAGGETPEEQLDAKVLGEAVTAYLAGLPKLQRMVFVRRYWYLNSIELVAKQMSISESKVKSMLYRTRRDLRAYLEKEGLL